jgi:AcrR family transcriptional regulator
LKSQSTRSRATRADWLAAALGALHKEGPKGLNIQALARQLNISKTSFYWHFKDKAELIDALIDLWRHEFTETITEIRPERMSGKKINLSFLSRIERRNFWYNGDRPSSDDLRWRNRLELKFAIN